MNEVNLIHKQLNSILSKKIEMLYQTQLKHEIGDIIYHISEKELAIVMEGSVTQLEKLLHQNHQEKLAKEVRSFIDKTMRSEIKRSIEEVMEVNVVDFVSYTTIDTDRTIVIAILEVKK
jgi:uncharacterized protein YbcI